MICDARQRGSAASDSEEEDTQPTASPLSEMADMEIHLVAEIQLHLDHYVKAKEKTHLWFKVRRRLVPCFRLKCHGWPVRLRLWPQVLRASTLDELRRDCEQADQKDPEFTFKKLEASRAARRGSVKPGTHHPRRKSASDTAERTKPASPVRWMSVDAGTMGRSLGGSPPPARWSRPP